MRSMVEGAFKSKRRVRQVARLRHFATLAGSVARMTVGRQDAVRASPGLNCVGGTIRDGR